VVALITAGSNLRGDGGARALCEACRHGHVDAAAALLAAGADPNGVALRWQYDGEQHVQCWSIMVPSANPAFVPLLPEYGGSLVADGESLVKAAAHGYVATLWLLLPMHAGPEHEKSRLCAAVAACCPRQLPALAFLLDPRGGGRFSCGTSCRC
jgi:hypothetical protein